MAERVSSEVVEIELAERRPHIRGVLVKDDAHTLRSMLQNSQVAVDDQDEFQATLLHMACEYHCPRCVGLLLRHPHYTALKVYDVNGHTPIHIAAHCNQVEIINVLHRQDPALIHCLSTHKETPLMIGCLAGHISVVRCLHDLGAKLQVTNAEGSTLLHYAASSGDAEMLDFVLQLEGMREYVDSQNNRGDTPTHNAMRNGCVECVKVLCRHGANFNIRNSFNRSPVDVATALDNKKCLAIFNNFNRAMDQKAHGGSQKTVPTAPAKNASTPRKATYGVPQGPRKSQTKYSLPPTPPASLCNDQKGEFHGTSSVETETSLHGENNSESNKDSSHEEPDGRFPSRAASYSHERPSDKRLLNSGHSTERDRAQSLPTPRSTATSQPNDLSLTQAMKKKTPKPAPETARDKQHTLKERRQRTPNHPSTDPPRKRTSDAKSEKTFPLENSSATTDPVSLPRIFPTEVPCQQCGKFMWGRMTTYEGADDITLLDAHIRGAKKVEQPSTFCPNCDKNTSTRSELSSRSDSNLHHTELPPQQPMAGPQQNGEQGQEELDSGIFLSTSLTQSHKSNGGPRADEQAPPIVIDEEPEDVEVKYGDIAVLHCRAHSTLAINSNLDYQWYKKKGAGSKEKIKGAKGPELRKTVDMKRPLVVYCRVSLTGNKDIFQYSKHVKISPILVWFTDQPQSIDGYLEEIATLTCKAVTAPGIKDPIRYLWLKRVSREVNPGFYKDTPDGSLTFDPLTPESEGYYTCQAGIDAQHAESEEVYVKGKIPSKRSSAGLLQITKQPRSYAVKEGDQLSLSCEAKQTADGEGPLYYQWYHNGAAIAGATAPTHEKTGVQKSDIGDYHCVITSGCGQSVRTKEVEVAFVHPDTSAAVSYAGKSSTQIMQVEARRHLKTIDGRRFARGKIALLIGNQCYDADSLPNLSTPENDVKSLADTLKECGFKVFSLVNLRYDEMMTALSIFYSLLVPGIYAVFAYTGHGCTYQGVDYFIPVDAHGPDPSHCVSNATISDNLQQHLCRVFKFIDCCRVQSATKTSHTPKNSRKYNFANIFEIYSCGDGQRAFENQSHTHSSFNKALTAAIRPGRTFMDVFDNIGQSMAENCEATPGAAYAEPTCSTSSMDKEISFHDRVMLDDPQYEEKLDRLHKTWTKLHTLPVPGKIQIGEVLSEFLNVAELEFDSEFSNVLLVKMKWQIYPTTCSSCSVTMTSGEQEVAIETAAQPQNGAEFRIISLQRLKADLKLHLTFTIKSTDGTPSQHTVSQDLQCRPLYAQLALL